MRGQTDAHIRDILHLGATGAGHQVTPAHQHHILSETLNPLHPGAVESPTAMTATDYSRLWQEVEDPITGRRYYVNRDTKQSVWTRPDFRADMLAQNSGIVSAGETSWQLQSKNTIEI